MSTTIAEELKSTVESSKSTEKHSSDLSHDLELLQEQQKKVMEKIHQVLSDSEHNVTSLEQLLEKAQVTAEEYNFAFNIL